MTISKFTTNLYASEVYRELERNAVKKGFFKPTETETIKLAAEQVSIEKEVNKPIDTNISGDLLQDVSKLAYALRRKGFVTQAEEIESNLVSYSQAEKFLYDIKIDQCENEYNKDCDLFPGNELGTIETIESISKKIQEIATKEPTVKQASFPYGVTSESMNDIINFAHRDGDVDVVGWGEQGVFETIHSIADKILEVANKQPTGRLPIEKLAALVKEAQVSDDVEIYANNVDGNLKRIAGNMVIDFGFSSNVLNENGGGNFLLDNQGLAALFNDLGADYNVLASYGKKYKTAFSIETPKSINDFSTTILNTIRSFMANQQPMGLIQNINAYLGGIGNYKIESGSDANVIAAQIAKDLLDLFIKARAEFTKAVKALSVRKANSETAAEKIIALSNMPKHNNEQVFSFASKTIGAIPQIKNEIWWSKRVLNAIGKNNVSEELDSSVYAAESNAKTLQDNLKKQNPELVAANDVLSKLTALESKISEKKNPNLNGALGIVQKLISAVGTNNLKALQELGYASVGEIVPDIAKMESKLS